MDLPRADEKEPDWVDHSVERKEWKSVVDWVVLSVGRSVEMLADWSVFGKVARLADDSADSSVVQWVVQWVARLVEKRVARRVFSMVVHSVEPSGIETAGNSVGKKERCNRGIILQSLRMKEHSGTIGNLQLIQ
jgi:hypothetical protein